MLILRIILITIGLVFIGLGYSIWLKEKYNLINMLLGTVTFTVRIWYIVSDYSTYSYN